MATLNTLTLDGDGTIDAIVEHDAGTGSPFYTHCNDDPDSSSSDYVQNDTSETAGFAWFSLSNVNADFTSMDTLTPRVDREHLNFSNDLGQLIGRIYDADNDTTNPLCNQFIIENSAASGTREQVTLGALSGLTGTKAQWDTAHLRLEWTYNKTGGPDNGQLRLYGIEFDGTYTASSVGSKSGKMTLLGVQ